MIQTLRDNCLDANRSQKLDSSAVHLWAVLLAGGDGVRLRDLMRRIVGDSRPKQFCRIIGEQSLFRETRTRLDPLFIRDRQVFVLFRAHERYYGLRILRHDHDAPAPSFLVTTFTPTTTRFA